jgi:phosphatidylserine/phosphatidylglycerophosphate/cardiolipin synthase-like enzyme
LPDDSQKAQEHILDLINNANKNIKVAIYSFTYKKFAKALKKASKKGVDVTVIYFKTKKDFFEKLNFHKRIKLIKSKRKLHIKLAIIDDKYLIFGSANWKKESFGQNYEIVNIIDDKQQIDKFIDIFEKLKKEKN